MRSAASITPLDHRKAKDESDNSGDAFSCRTDLSTIPVSNKGKHCHKMMASVRDPSTIEVQSSQDTADTTPATTTAEIDAAIKISIFDHVQDQHKQANLLAALTSSMSHIFLSQGWKWKCGPWSRNDWECFWFRWNYKSITEAPISEPVGRAIATLFSSNTDPWLVYEQARFQEQHLDDNLLQMQVQVQVRDGLSDRGQVSELLSDVQPTVAGIEMSGRRIGAWCRCIGWRRRCIGFPYYYYRHDSERNSKRNSKRHCDDRFKSSRLTVVRLMAKSSYWRCMLHVS